MDGPQAEQLELGPCGQILQDEDKSKREEKLVGQGSSMECSRPFCSPKNTRPCLPWPYSSLVCDFVTGISKHLPLGDKAP